MEEKNLGKCKICNERPAKFKRQKLCQRCYSREYYHRPGIKKRKAEYYNQAEVKSKRQSYARNYNKQPEVAERRRRYSAKRNQRPDVKEWRRNYMREYRKKIKEQKGKK